MDSKSDLFEAELCSGNECTAHEHGEHGVAGHVVTIDDVNRAARVIGEDVWVVKGDAYKEHGDSPAERPEHPLTSVAGDVVVQVAQCRRVSHRDRRCAQELTHYL